MQIRILPFQPEGFETKLFLVRRDAQRPQEMTIK